MAQKAPGAMQVLGTGRRGETLVTGTITIGAAGAIATNGVACELATVVKTAAKTGRYTVTFLKKYKNVRVANLDLVGPADVALTATDGNDIFCRNLSGTSVDIQARQTSYADANPASGNVIHFGFWCQDR